MRSGIIDVIAGARPNFMKVAALFAMANEFPELQLRLVHTGQHYDVEMSDVFFRELGLPQPVHHLGVGSGSHAHQTAEIMKRYEAFVEQSRPDLCLVVGDVNSTLACSLVSAKLLIPVAHVEAGLRSFDRSMPEEVNRVVTDAVSDLMFATESVAVQNLRQEGRPAEGIHLVGNVMIDTLRRMISRAATITSYRQYPAPYAFVTLHRPANVDDPERLKEVWEQLRWLSNRMTVVFAVHPRTRARLKDAGLVAEANSSFRLVEPLGYLETLSLQMHAAVVVTDSGGLQEESSALGVPCLTLRPNTERPVTVLHGTNTIIGDDWNLFRDCVQRIKKRRYLRRSGAIPHWDGAAAGRILTVCCQFLGVRFAAHA